MRGPRRPCGARSRHLGAGITDLARPDLFAGRGIGRDQPAPATRSGPAFPIAAQLAGCILFHCLAHPPDRFNLVVERLPVIAVRNGRPDRLDLVDMHRAGAGVRPIGVRWRLCPAIQQPGKLAEFVGGIGSCTRIAAAAPVEEDAVDRLRLGRKGADQARRRSRGRSLAGAMPRRRSNGVDQRLLEPSAPAGENLGEQRRLGDQRQAAGELREVPVDRFRLPPERVEPVMVEVSGGEFRLPIGREAPRTVIEAFPGDVDIVAVEDAVDEAGGEVGSRESRQLRWLTRSNSRSAFSASLSAAGSA